MVMRRSAFAAVLAMLVSLVSIPAAAEDPELEEWYAEFPWMARVTLTWESPNADLDLWILWEEPSGYDLEPAEVLEKQAPYPFGLPDSLNGISNCERYHPLGTGGSLEPYGAREFEELFLSGRFWIVVNMIHDECGNGAKVGGTAFTVTVEYPDCRVEEHHGAITYVNEPLASPPVYESHFYVVAEIEVAEIAPGMPACPPGGNAPPSIDALAVVPPVAGTGEPVAVVATVSDPEDQPLTYRWRMDGEPLLDDGPVASLGSLEAGRHRVTLWVTDPFGETVRLGTDVDVIEQGTVVPWQIHGVATGGPVTLLLPEEAFDDEGNQPFTYPAGVPWLQVGYTDLDSPLRRLARSKGMNATNASEYAADENGDRAWEVGRRVAGDGEVNPRIRYLNTSSNLMTEEERRRARSEEVARRSFVVQMLARVAEFSTLTTADGTALFPSLRNNGIRRILLHFALGDLTGTDPGAVVKMGRFISFLLYNDMQAWD
jgi:hypothetical protein